MGAGGPPRRGRGRRAGPGLQGSVRRAGRLPPARARRGVSAVLPPLLPRPLPPPLPPSLAPSLPRGFRGGGGGGGGGSGTQRGQVPYCPVPFVAYSGSGRPRRAELRGARRGSCTATTEQPRDWPPRAPFAAVPFPGALTPFSGWDCSGGADSAGIAAEAAAAERGSMFSPGQEEHCAPNKEPVKYGELVVLG